MTPVTFGEALGAFERLAAGQRRQPETDLVFHRLTFAHEPLLDRRHPVVAQRDLRKRRELARQRDR